MQEGGLRGQGQPLLLSGSLAQHRRPKGQHRARRPPPPLTPGTDSPLAGAATGAGGWLGGGRDLGASGSLQLGPGHLAGLSLGEGTASTFPSSGPQQEAFSKRCGGGG